MSTIADIKERIVSRHQHQTVFCQALTEFFDSIGPYLEHVQAPASDYARLERLLVPERVISFRVTWENDAGELMYNTGYRVQYSAVLGPYKGGLRFDPSVNEDVLKFLGFEQIFKNALTGLPLGAGKGGSDFDPKGKSDTEVRRFCIAFMTALHRHIGPNTDVPAGDIGVGAREIGYLYGAYKQLMNRSEGVLTGKSTNFGGSCGRTEATGYGVVYFAAEMLQANDDTLQEKTAVVSGSGNVAIYAAEKLIEEGSVVKTLSDRHGYFVSEQGFTHSDLEEIVRCKQARRPLSEITIEGAEYHEGKPWQHVTADLYFPCATQNEIDEADAKAIVATGATLVVEGANMPSDLAAVNVFKDSEVLFAPGKAANAGGVAVSGLEMTQNASHHPWKCDDVDVELREIMKNIHSTCIKYGRKDDGTVDYVDGANIGGFVPVFAGMCELGW